MIASLLYLKDLYAGAGVANRQLARTLDTSVPTVLLWRGRYQSEGLAGILEDRPRAGRPKRISAEKEAAIVEATRRMVHHSDRGVQYASQDYTDLLKNRGITISMSCKGNPYDNAACESFMKTLKYEEVHRQEYRDATEARASIEHFLERVYNQTRLHSALGYRPPMEFEQHLPQPRPEAQA